jgi:hypothetical protein
MSSLSKMFNISTGNKNIYAVFKWYLGLHFTQWRSLGNFSSEAIRRAQRGEKMLGGSGN